MTFFLLKLCNFWVFSDIKKVIVFNNFNSWYKKNNSRYQKIIIYFKKYIKKSFSDIKNSIF